MKFISKSCRLILIAVGFVLPVVLLAQETHPEWEKYLERSDENVDQSQLLEQLEDWLKQPLDLNQASSEEMLCLPGFPAAGAYAVLQWRHQKGRLPTMAKAKELIAVDEELWGWLAQFITVRIDKPAVKRQADFRLRVTRPVELARGYQENVFRGSSEKIYQRYRAQLPPSWRLAVLAEKDGGETRLDDHLIFSVVKDWQRQQSQLVLGSYSLNLGLGLIVWSSFVTGKGSDPFYSSQRHSQMIRPYVSAGEAHFFRGAAFSSAPGKWRFAGWYSRAPADANISTNGEITSFDETGLHRTPAECAKQNRTTIRLQGGMAGYEFSPVLRVQVTALQAEFTPAIAPSNTEPADWRFSGKKMQVYGFTLNWSFDKMDVFSEIAWQNSNALAILTGFTTNWRQTQLSLLHRHYSPRYDNPFAQGFGEWTNTRNETGWYLAWQLLPFTHTKWLLAADLFTTLWRSYDQPLPQRGAEIYLQWEQQVNRNFLFYLRYTNDQKPLWTTTESISPQERKLILPGQTQRLRCHFQIQLAKNYEVNGRAEAIHDELLPEFYPTIERQRQWGWLFYWDWRCRPSTRFGVSARLTFFDTQTYPIRAYQFEQDVPGVLSSKLLYGQGLRYYFLLNWQLNHWLKISAKYASTRYEDRKTIGSGWDELISAVEHSFTLQLDGEI